LVFGKDSYVSHYITQCAAVGKIPKAIGGSKGFQYKPVASEDLAIAVETALAKTDQVKGKRFTVSGAQTATLNELLHLAEKQVGKESGSTSLKSSFLGLGLSDYVEEFFTGITHDKNMARMA
jgi:nucleoside-diphosphate-sugar epimerase